MREEKQKIAQLKSLVGVALTGTKKLEQVSASAVPMPKTEIEKEYE